MGEFVEGDMVEVCSKEDGLLGGQDPQALVETISADEIRPMPPKLSQPSMFSLHDKVDAFDLDAWCSEGSPVKKAIRTPFTFQRPTMCASTHFNVSEGISNLSMVNGFLQQQGNDELLRFSYASWFHHQFTDTDRDPQSPTEGLWFSHVLWIFDTRYIKYKTQQRDGLEAAMVLQKDNWFPRLVNSVGGIGVTIGYHVIWLVNSVGHFWGSRSWKTKDTSRNVWWLSLFTMGDSWHNNHHAFETSARHGFEWWQIDITWYLIRLFEILGLATDVKLPSEFQKQKMSLACSS
ncbi:hypothetical protein F2Q68_00038400 [Brassica cretica]|uniref:Fatty acid desaturase domain-containing protein n=1 Tax=Brassica cretica TaxID=69181 RepID=A0A8S9MSC8_BRACR|nr:hypothetical protein F2Q68_00038400 [Brassica cretica]